MYFRIVISYTVILDSGCATVCSPHAGKLARATPSSLVQKGAALEISGSLEIAACWHSAPGLWGWPLIILICNKHFVHKPYLMQYIYFNFLGFRVWIIKPTNTYIANVRERCWKNLLILAHKFITKAAHFWDSNYGS